MLKKSTIKTLIKNKFLVSSQFQLEKERITSQLNKKNSNLDKYLLLAWLKKNDFNLFSKLILDSPKILLPLVYTPTIGEVCLNYSSLTPFLPHEGLIVNLDTLPAFDKILANYQKEFGVPQIAVLTDGSRVLGLGDLGINGFPICWGKSQLLSIFAEIESKKILPIIFDCGTDNPKNLKNPFYLGLKKKRPKEKLFYRCMDSLLSSLTKKFPRILIHFEDFQTKYALGMLERYQNKYLCFNDDIQGTGAVVLAGLINAMKKNKLLPTQQRILLVGAGSASVGVAKMLLIYFQREHGLETKKTKQLIWGVDSQGLITKNRRSKLTEHKKIFFHEDNSNQPCQKLSEIIDYVKPTILIGLSGKKGIFTPRILGLMAKYNQKPIIFALSNPETNAECSLSEAMKHTNNQAIFASGTDFPNYFIPLSNKICRNNQANNMYIFPGLERGILSAKTKIINDFMVYEAAKTLAESLTDAEKRAGYLYPCLSRMQEVSKQIASAIVNFFVLIAY